MGKIFNEEPGSKVGVASPDAIFTQICSEMKNLAIEGDKQSSHCSISSERSKSNQAKKRSF